MSEKKKRDYTKLVVPKKLKNASHEEKQKWRNGEYQKNRNLKKKEKRLADKFAEKTTAPELAESAEDKFLKFKNVVQSSGVQYLRNRQKLNLLQGFSDRARLDKRDNIEISFAKMNRRLIKHYHTRDPSTFNLWPRSVQLVIKESPLQYPKISPEQCATIRPRYIVSKRDDEKFLREMKSTIGAFDLETKELLQTAKNQQAKGNRLLGLGSKRKYDDAEIFDDEEDFEEDGHDEKEEEENDADKTDDEEDFDVKFGSPPPPPPQVSPNSKKFVDKYDSEIEDDIEVLKEDIAKRKQAKEEKEAKSKKAVKTKETKETKKEVKKIKMEAELAVSVVLPPSPSPLAQPIDANLTSNLE